MKYPSLYQINTRVWLTELSSALGRPATFDAIPEAELDRLASMGFQWIWFLSVWTTGEQSQKVSRENHLWRHEFELTLPDLKEEDIGGSGFAITDYHVHPRLGGDAALKRLREKLHQRGLKLMLDFVPNHMGLGHPWIQDHPEYFVSGTEQDIKNNPENYTRVRLEQGEKIFAYGRDPYFSGWPDTLQLDYSNPGAADAMRHELVRIAQQCDGVRCDMAMLILPEIFERTWGCKAQVFWPVATAEVLSRAPGFCFLAEVYWDMEWTLQQQGFNYTYDKRLYDRLHEGNAKNIREHFGAGIDYQDKLARFLENHDEPRAAATFDKGKHKAAAIITFLSPGLRFFHQGQFEGKLKRISPHLIRGPREPLQADIQKFYTDLLVVIRQPIFQQTWRLLECVPGWNENESWNSFVAFAWEEQPLKRVLVVVNYSVHAGQCHIKIPFTDLANQSIRFREMMTDAHYDWKGSDLVSKGMYVDLPAWGYHIFEMIVL